MSKIILLNKPFNVLSQFTDKMGRTTLSDYLDIKNVYPAGRLDYDSEGLVVLTDDGQLQHQISHPKAKLSKTYWVQIEGTPSEEALNPLREGLHLKDGPCHPAKVKRIDSPNCWDRNPPIRERHNTPTCWLEIIITEGRNRQVRRMTAALGFPTLRLIRAKVGQWTVNGIAPGCHKILTVHASKSKYQNTRHTRKPRRTV